MEKTIKTMLALMAGALTFSACSSEYEFAGQENSNGAKLVTLTAYQEADAISRAAIDGTTSTQIDWSTGDKINYFGAGTTSESMTLSDGAGTKTGTFSGTVTTSGTTDYVLYPYNEDATCSGGTITTTIPSQQAVPAGSFDPKAGIMVGQVKENNGNINVQFYNAVGYIAITIPSGQNDITKMVITGNNNERLTGKITISGMSATTAPTSINGTTRTPATYSSAAEITDGVKYVEVTPATGNTFVAGSTYYVAVAPDAALSQGIYVLLYNGTTSDKAKLKLAAKKTSTNLGMTRKHVSKLTLPAITWTDMIALKDASGTDNGLYMAPFNLGATASTEYGSYYSFGEIDTKSSYSSSAYTGTDDLTGLTDAATSNWGPDWRMQTKTEWDNNKSNSSVFGLPLAGNCYGTELGLDGSDGIYWSSTASGTNYGYYLITDGVYYINVLKNSRSNGSSVRPVLAK